MIDIFVLLWLLFAPVSISQEIQTQEEMVAAIFGSKDLSDQERQELLKWLCGIDKTEDK